MSRIKRGGFQDVHATLFCMTLAPILATSLFIQFGAARVYASDRTDEERLMDWDYLQRANPALVLDGSYVMTAGDLHVNITNVGFVGSHWSWGARWSHAPSAQWPAGSSIEYLHAGGLWVGGQVLGTRSVSTGIYDYQEIMALPEPEDTVYEAIGTRLVRPPGNTIASGRRFPDVNPNDDNDFDPDFPWVELIDEETLNGYDDDGDGLIDEDFAQIGNQMMVATMYDNTPLSMEWFPDHRPLNLKIVQESYAWENPLVQDFVGFEYTLTNIGVLDITDMYVGFLADCAIAPRSVGGAGSRDDMAGTFSGPVRASDGTWVKVEMGFMWDAAEQEKVDGYFGVVLLGHTTDPSGVKAPRSVGLHTVRILAAMGSYQTGGRPANDMERYEAMSDPEWSDDVMEGSEEDYSVLVSAGPFPKLSPDENITFSFALVVGDGLDGLKRNAAEAKLTYYGSYFEVIDAQTNAYPLPEVPIGFFGRETIRCVSDYPNVDAFRAVYPDFGDESCAPSMDWLATRFDSVRNEDIFIYARDPRFSPELCIMVNMDNCYECYRLKNHEAVPGECTPAEFDAHWNCHRVGADPRACTGIDGRETHVDWLVGMAPPPPGMRVWPADRSVHVFWDNRSEITPDVRLNVIDFQSYRIWRADNWTRPVGTDIDTGPAANLWQLIAEYDVVDSFMTLHEVSPTHTDTVWLPLGRNTGLDQIRYTPRVLEDPRFVGLADSMRVVASRDPRGVFNNQLPRLFVGPGEPNWITEPVLPWQGYPDALDTFWAVTVRSETTYVDDQTGEEIYVVGKDPIWYYRYSDHEVHNGFQYFYSVTATDHDMRQIPGTDEFQIVGPGLSGDPSGSFAHTAPGRFAQTAEQRERERANIFVYPNPATRRALREFQQLEPNENDPTGVRVNFANLPRAQNKISIFTVSGDLVETIEHDGSHGYGEASWNLISRNGQEVVSGIYLYTVQSTDSAFDDFIGKFVVVR